MKSRKTFIKKGDKIIVKEVVPDIELSHKDVMTNIGGLQEKIMQTQQQINQFTMQTTELKRRVEDMTERLDKIKKFEDWAVEIQLSKLKAVLPEATKRVQERLCTEYKYDEGLSLEDNKKQLMHMLIGYVGRDKDVVDNIAQPMINAHIFGSTKFEDIWKDMTEIQLKAWLKNNSI